MLDQISISPKTKYLKAEDPVLDDWYEEIQSDDIVWDIGAHVGAYTVVASKAGSEKVIAFEPLRDNVQAIHYHLDLNDENAFVMPVALSNHAGFDTFGYGNETRTHRGASLNKVGEGNMIVPVLQASMLHPIAPDVVKVDVEGRELDVLEGMLPIMSSVRTLYVEVHHEADHRSTPTDPDELLDFLGGLGDTTEIHEREHESFIRVDR